MILQEDPAKRSEDAGAESLRFVNDFIIVVVITITVTTICVALSKWMSKVTKCLTEP